MNNLVWILIIIAVTALFAVLFFVTRHVMRVNAEKKRLEYEKQQEQELNRMHMRFFANVAHEFRTPLTSIIGPLSLLAAREDLDREQKKLLSVMSNSTERMMSLVNQFLDFNKLENDTFRLEVSLHNITDILRMAADYFEVNARMKNISISTQGLNDDVQIMCDYDKMYKMVSNLMSNAIKYTQEGGHIILGLYKSKGGSEVNIFVADNGIGIAPEQRQKVFERYYRVPGSNEWGTGIGLYYVKSLAEKHHGSVSCTANNQNEEGRGSVFTITLPALPSAYSQKELASSHSQSFEYPIEHLFADAVDTAEPEEKVRTRILVVDDDIDICNYLKILLHSADYNVEACYSVDSALKKIKEWEPDILISDVSMPGKDGYELCRTVRHDMSLSHLPVILVTARVDASDKITGIESGADAYITKPFDPKYLLAVVKSQFEKRHNIQHTIIQSTDVMAIEEDDSISMQDKAFLSRLYEIMEENLSDLELDINSIAANLHISRTKLYYKVKGLTGESPAAFFKNFKLNKAAEMICSGQHNVSEISDMTGFASLSHFSTSFKKQFGMTPSEYAKKKK